MTIMLDQESVTAELPNQSTVGDALMWAQQRLLDTGKVIVKVELDGNVLEGPLLNDHQQTPIQDRHLGIFTADQKVLAHTMLGKLAALVEFLNTRHHETAALIEQGQIPKALEHLGGIFSAWQQIQQAFTSLTRLLHLDLDALAVGEQSATSLISDFHQQLQEIQQALQSQDMVLLSDILQYEMDRATTNWNNLLALVLGVVDGVV